MHRASRGAFVAAAAALLTSAAPAGTLAAQDPAPVRVPVLSAPPTIDGRLGEPAWQEAARLDGFVQTQPGDNAAPTHPTTVLLGRDAEHLYVAVHASDVRGQVRATLARRDDVLDDDHVAIYLDTFGDQRRAYVLRFNPFGVQQDGVYAEGTGTDYNVDVAMRSGGTVGDSGWTVEAVIPFRSLRFTPDTSRRWGLHVVRVRHASREEDSWRPLVRGRADFLGQAGRLGGLAVAAPRAFEVLPTLTALRAERRSADGRFTPMASEVRPGLSARLGLSAGLAADLALRPDFAQVEADAPQITANQRYPLFYEEKRPFFLEGVAILQTPLQVVHTRAIIDPDAALKLSGKAGRTEFAVLAASDRGPGSFDDAELADSAARARVEDLIGRRATVAIVRARRDVGARSSLGLIATGYDFVARRGLLAGADGRLTLGDHDALTWQLAGTVARRRFVDPDAGADSLRTREGIGYYLQWRRTGRRWNHTGALQGRSAAWVADLGYTTRVNYNALTWETRYDSEPRPDAFLLSWSATLGAYGQVDWSGRPTYAWLYPHVTWRLPWRSSVDLGAYADYLRLEEGEFGARRTPGRPGAFAGAPTRETVYRGLTLQLSTAPSERWSGSLAVDAVRRFFDFDFGAAPRYPRVSPAALADSAAPLDPGLADGLSLDASLTWRASDRWRWTLAYHKARFVRRDTRRVAFDENLLSSSTTYQVSRFLAVRLRLDWASLESRLADQLLLAWTPSPTTALYLGWSDDLSWNGWDPATRNWRRGVRREGRTVFAKSSYLIRPLG